MVLLKHAFITASLAQALILRYRALRKMAPKPRQLPGQSPGSPPAHLAHEPRPHPGSPPPVRKKMPKLYQDANATSKIIAARLLLRSKAAPGCCSKAATKATAPRLLLEPWSAIGSLLEQDSLRGTSSVPGEKDSSRTSLVEETEEAKEESSSSSSTLSIPRPPPGPAQRGTVSLGIADMRTLRGEMSNSERAEHTQMLFRQLFNDDE